MLKLKQHSEFSFKKQNETRFTACYRSITNLLPVGPKQSATDKNHWRHTEARVVYRGVGCAMSDPRALLVLYGSETGNAQVRRPPDTTEST